MNKKEKYYYDPEKLSYIKIKRSFLDRLRSFILFTLVVVLCSIVCSIIFFSFVDSPKEKYLKREQRNIKLNYDILDNRINRLSVVLDDLTERDNNIYRVIFMADSIPKSIRKSGFGGIHRYNKLKGFDNSELIIKITKKTDILEKQILVQSKSYDEVVSLLKKNTKMMASIPSIQPVSNKDLKRMASGYGYRIDPIYKIRKMHHGMDFSAPEGTPIYATGNGIVDLVRSELSKKSKMGYGNCVRVNHGYRTKTFYAHMQKIIVKKGQRVKKGQIIGYVGNTGKSTAPHLHYEVRINGKSQNPVHYYYEDLTPEQYQEMLNLSETQNQSMD